MMAKQNNPSQFASHWEMDEQDVDEATEEEIQSKYLINVSFNQWLMQYL